MRIQAAQLPPQTATSTLPQSIDVLPNKWRDMRQYLGRYFNPLELQLPQDSSQICHRFKHHPANGVLFFHIFGPIAQFERELIRERTLAGLQSARARERLGGRPQALDQKTRALAVSMYNDSSHPVKDICATLKYLEDDVV
jgi:Resolvase, N terminal domain